MTFGPTFGAVLAAAQSGAPWALERLYADLAATVAGYLRVQGATEPEDLTSDVFVKVFNGISGFSGDEPQFRSWVFTIAHHCLVDERRRYARRLPVCDTDVSELSVPSADDVEGEAVRHLGVRRVRRMCDGLAPDQRDVLLLRMVGDMTLEQTAEALGKSPGAVKALQHRAVAALRRMLEREGVSP